MAVRIATIVFFPSLLVSLILACRTPDLWMIPAALAGWYGADFMSGAAHMYLDYRPCVPGIGLDKVFFYEGSRGTDEYVAFKKRITRQIYPFERLVFEFKLHHPRPDSLGRRSFLYLVNSPSIYLALIPALALNIGCWLGVVPGWLAVGTVVFLFGAVLAQYFHGYLHRADAPWYIALPRRLRLLMTPADHAVHHETLTRDFSTTSGWSNPLLNVAFNALRGWGMFSPAGLTPR